ncbi:MAG: response regulator transcription factor, partial [Pseudomonadota bacterium]
MRVAIADDEQELLGQFSSVVTRAGHEIETFRNGSDLLNALKRETYDVILLDWNMPGKTGIEVLEWASDNLTPMPPFILITSRHEEGDIVRGLEAGAVDYIIKPESDEVIRARINAAGRRTTDSSPARFANFGVYELDRTEMSIKKGDERIKLTGKEFELADLFFSNLDRPMSRGYIFSRVWGGHVDLETRTIDVHISGLQIELCAQP